MFPQVTPTVYHYQDSSSLYSAFQRDGYVVVSDLPISSDDITFKFIQDLKQIIPVPVDITPENMWSLQEVRDYPGSRMQGLVGEYGLSQGDAAWAVRTNAGIQEVFQCLLNTDKDNLVCSTDAIGFSTDNELTSNAKWLHTDQNRLILGNDILSIQSIFYAEDTPEDPDGLYACTVVVPGSHLDDNTLSIHTSHFCMVDRKSNYYNRAVRLRMKKGQLVLFNSYLVHQGWHGRHRLCFMVSYGLKSNRTELVKQRKVLMYLCGHKSTHWSHLGQLHGHKYLQEEASDWLALVPRLINNPPADLIDYFKRDLYEIGTDWYTDDLDTYIPTERLNLL